MLGKRSKEDGVSRYAESHQHPFNRFCHTIGIPMITVALPLFGLLIFRPDWWLLPTGLFVVGWLLQFVGHAIEGKPPEFLRDWRFLLVGLHWWLAKIRRRL
jgi:uncharacterized membrane protein YGL010W